jgi:hypothetical protein
MEKFVAECNIEQFRKRLENTANRKERKLLEELLKNEQNRLLYFTSLAKNRTEIKEE